MSKIPKDMQEKSKFREVFEDNPELKQILFFGFYVIFFIFVIVLLRSAFQAKNNGPITKYNSGYGHSFNINNIKNNNYHFNYKVDKNNIVTIYDGDKYDTDTSFVMSGTPAITYYSKDDNYYLRDVNTLKYNLSNNPMEFANVIDNSALERMFTRGTYISKTEYIDDTKSDFNYEINSSTLLEITNNLETDLESINYITVKTDEYGSLYQIDMDLTNYYSYFDSSITKYNLTLTYSKFGSIEKIKNID